MSAYTLPIGMLILGAFLLVNNYPSSSSFAAKEIQLPPTPKSNFKDIKSPSYFAPNNSYKPSRILVSAPTHRAGRTVT